MLAKDISAKERAAKRVPRKMVNMWDLQLHTGYCGKVNGIYKLIVEPNLQRLFVGFLKNMLLR